MSILFRAACLAAVIAGPAVPAWGQAIDYQQSVSVTSKVDKFCIDLCQVTLAPVPKGMRLLVSYVGISYRLKSPSTETTAFLSMNGKPELLTLPLAKPAGAGPSYTSSTLTAAFFHEGYAPTVFVYGPQFTPQPISIAVVGIMTPDK